MHETKKKAPKGKYRVIGVDMFSHEDYLVGDYATRLKAIHVVDEKKKKAQSQGSLPDRYYAYNDKGEWIG
ncbi:MAG: hypothetical protein WC495_05880 [Patescibacteria group bacterium]|jgi:hypothetical protein